MRPIRHAACPLLVVAIATFVRSGVAIASTSTPPGSIGIRLVEAPKDLAADPRAHLYVIDHLDRGETIRRRIELSNGLAHPERLDLYAAGAFIANGHFRFLDDRAQNELSSWIRVNPPVVDVPAHGTASAVVTIAVPPTATDGERYAVVWAETPPSAGQDVVAVNRVGIRVYLSVGRGSAPAIDFQIRSLTARRDPDGRPVVSASVVNTGGRAIDVGGELRLSGGPGGLSAGPFPVELGTTIGIGQRAPVRTVLPRAIPDGPWTVDLRLRSDLTERRAEGRILFPSMSDARSAAVPVASPTDSVEWPVPIALGVGSLAIVAWLLLFARRRRRRTEGSSKREPIDDPVGG